MASDTRIGTTIAGYRIESVLGRGGMGVVYLAEQAALSRKVALKVMAPELASDPRFRDRFLRESRVAASLEDPNILPVYEAGEADGALFIAMRYVRGTDLRRLIDAEGRLEPGRTVSILLQVASALDAAHAEGLIHRDVKPANVLLVPGTPDKVYLADFGLTKRATSDSGVTGTGQFVGTLDYAAPEQFTGEQLTPQTDVYSLGCVLYECLTGEPPFPRDREAAVLHAHLNEPPPKPTTRQELPEALDRVVAKAMAKKAEDRYATAGALAAAARDACAPILPARRPSGRRALLPLSTAFVVALAVIAVVLARSGRGPVTSTPPTGSTASAPGGPPVGSVVEIDPATNRILGTVRGVSVSSGGGAGGSNGTGGMAAGQGGVWVVSGSNVAHVDALTRTLRQTIPYGSFGDVSLAVGSRTVWLLHSGLGATPFVDRLDPSTDKFLRSVPIEEGRPVSVAAGGAFAWIATTDGHVIRLEGATGRILGSWTLPGRVDVLVYGPGTLWAADLLGGTVYEIDPSTGETTGSVSVPGSIDGLAATEEALWILDSFVGTVTPIEAGSKSLGDPIPVGVDASGIAAGLDAVWVSSFDGSLYRVDPAVKEASPIDIGAPLAAVAVDEETGTVWVTVGRKANA
ncbi:MAG: protein kinase [Actinomycetota bacterium]|nr:protein kinase [Actinomycetota bacterium]